MIIAFISFVFLGAWTGLLALINSMGPKNPIRPKAVAAKLNLHRATMKQRQSPSHPPDNEQKSVLRQALRDLWREVVHGA